MSDLEFALFFSRTTEAQTYRITLVRQGISRLELEQSLNESCICFFAFLTGFALVINQSLNCGKSKGIKIHVHVQKKTVTILQLGVYLKAVISRFRYPKESLLPTMYSKQLFLIFVSFLRLDLCCMESSCRPYKHYHRIFFPVQVLSIYSHSMTAVIGSQRFILGFLCIFALLSLTIYTTCL